MFKYFIVFATALFLGVILTFCLARLSRKCNLLKPKGIPLVGGLGAGLAFLLACGLGVLIFDLAVPKVSAVAGVASLMLLFGIIDDLRELSILQKFLVQSFCAVLLIFFGIKTDIMYLGPWGNALVTFFWIVGMTNAFNLLDIMDGLATGTMLIVSSAFLLIGFWSADLNVQVFSLSLCAVSLGFLIFNLPPAKAYLGNSGSHFFGLLIAAVALITHYARPENAFALLSPVMILGLPIMDTILLIVFRVIKKKLPFMKSSDHLALKIGALGLSTRATVAVMYGLCFIFASCGVILAKVSHLLAGAIIISIFLFGIGIFIKLVKIEAYA